MTDVIKDLAAIKRYTGQPVQLKPYERLISSSASSTACRMLVETFTIHETGRIITFKQKGKRLVIWERQSDGTWITDQMVIWDETFVPEDLIKWGQVRSAAEKADRRDYERDCYRPGTSKNPLDNYDRVLAGQSAPKMERYW